MEEKHRIMVGAGQSVTAQVECQVESQVDPVSLEIMDAMDDDVQLQLALQLSKEEAERDAKRRLGDASGNMVVDETHYKLSYNAGNVGTHILAGLKKLGENKMFADIILDFGTEKLSAHRLVLCTWSETFRVMLQNENWKESQQQILPISLESERDVFLFKKMLHYMYTGETDVLFDDVISLLALSNYYAVLSLKDACSEILGRNIDQDNVLQLLEVVQQYSCQKLNKQCAEYLASNFSEMLKKDKLNSMEPDTWAEMINSDDIEVSTEEEVFEAVIRYATQFEGEKRNEVLNKLLPLIRYPHMEMSYVMANIENNPLLVSLPITHKILHETYRYMAFPNAPSSFKTNYRKGFFKLNSS
eukprot:TRINITY_DN91_c0_g1_i2.p1 TRINITY_DN91_c0_g1~~TRINITY_DN91_c0_g1_i2.p1  ORF type:complete len:359 (-),score=91.41 TRINITY_DN91_c0_g1_i2:629-1705(-)